MDGRLEEEDRRGKDRKEENIRGKERKIIGNEDLTKQFQF